VEKKVTREDIRQAQREIADKITEADLELLTRSLAKYRAERFLQDLQVIDLDWDDLEANR